MSKKGNKAKGKKGSVFTCRLTDIEREIIQGRAESANMSFSEYARHLLLKGPVTVHKTVCVEDPRLAEVLDKLCVSKLSFDAAARYLQTGGKEVIILEANILNGLEDLDAAYKKVREMSKEYRQKEYREYEDVPDWEVPGELMWLE